jgi:hypothetical protein
MADNTAKSGRQRIDDTSHSATQPASPRDKPIRKRRRTTMDLATGTSTGTDVGTQRYRARIKAPPLRQYTARHRTGAEGQRQRPSSTPKAMILPAWQVDLGPTTLVSSRSPRAGGRQRGQLHRPGPIGAWGRHQCATVNDYRASIHVSNSPPPPTPTRWEANFVDRN